MGGTAFHFAAGMGNIPMLKMLLDKVTYPDAQHPVWKATRANAARVTAGVGRLGSGAYGTLLEPDLSPFPPPDLLSPRPSSAPLAGLREVCSKGRKLSPQRMMLWSRDIYGNTALHIAVLHRRLKAFDWLLDFYGQCVGGSDDEMELKEKHDALHATGACGLTPLGLATVLGHRETFEHVIESMCMACIHPKF
eukprot:gene57825-biopygen47876